MRKYPPWKKKRREITETYNVSRDKSLHITLREIIKIENADASLLDLGMEFERVILRIQRRQELNARLMNDNIHFFNSFIAELKNSAADRTGYTEKGKENEKAINSLLLNEMA